MILIPEPPPPVLELERRTGFLYRVEEPEKFTSEPEVAPTELLLRIPPHKQYTILFEKLAWFYKRQATEPERGVPAELVGWRFLEWSRSGRVGARLIWADEVKLPLPGESRLVYFNLGRYVERSVEGWRRAEELQQPGTFYFRLLVLPFVYMVAVWLHRTGNGFTPRDRLMPISPPPPEEGARLEEFRIYPPDEFFGLLETRIPAAITRAPAPRGNDLGGGPKRASAG